MTKYAFLTKETMQQDYDELGTLSAIGRKYDMPTASVKTCARRLSIKMDPPGGKCKYTVNEDFFELDTEEGFYVAGFMAADGNITEEGDGPVTFTAGTDGGGNPILQVGLGTTSTPVQWMVEITEYLC